MTEEINTNWFVRLIKKHKDEIIRAVVAEEQVKYADTIAQLREENALLRIENQGLQTALDKYQAIADKSDTPKEEKKDD